MNKEKVYGYLCAYCIGRKRVTSSDQDRAVNQMRQMICAVVMITIAPIISTIRNPQTASRTSPIF